MAQLTPKQREENRRRVLDLVRGIASNNSLEAAIARREVKTITSGEGEGSGGESRPTRAA